MYMFNPSNLYRKVIGSYEYFQNRIAGRGTNSVVFEGNKINTREPVCVKHMHIKSAIAERCAKTQIEVLKKTQHKNVLSLVANFERGSSIYIVTQRCEMNLLTKLKKEPKVSEIQGLKLFLQILEGYEELRNRGYIHRDIKPENILVKDGVMKIADFGYATLLKKVSIKQPYNVGTPLYMAPQTLSFNIYSQKSDIWSLGITLHEIIHGKTPFTSQTQQQLRKELRKPPKICTCDEKIMNLLINCLSYEVQKRFDLQRLMLQVKLTINQLTERQSVRQIEEQALKKSFICINQLNYIRFLNQIKFLTKRARHISLQVKERINFLFQHQIQMRLKFNEKLFDDHSGCLSDTIIEKFKIYQREHQQPLDLPLGVTQNDRLYFFSLEIVKFQESLQWQTQAELKDLIRNILSHLNICKSEFQVIIRQETIKLVDFMLSAFALNRMLIQKENNREDFARLSNLTIILNSPCRVSSKVLQEIRKKAHELRVL